MAWGCLAHTCACVFSIVFLNHVIDLSLTKLRRTSDASFVSTLLRGPQRTSTVCLQHPLVSQARWHLGAHQSNHQPACSGYELSKVPPFEFCKLPHPLQGPQLGHLPVSHKPVNAPSSSGRATTYSGFLGSSSSSFALFVQNVECIINRRCICCTSCRTLR